jgi:feruloyl esterase
MTDRRTLSLVSIVTLFLVATAVTAPAAVGAQSCESLSKPASPTVSINVAAIIDTGTSAPAGNKESYSHLPAFCRVVVTLKPTPDSDIRAEIWLPVSGWNGKFLAAGSGGWGGTVEVQSKAGVGSTVQMRIPLRRESLARAASALE